MFTEPPRAAIAAAIEAGRRSPCAKSKRGAAVFHPATTTVYGVGFNGQPPPFACDGSDRCRKECGRICVHAETRAIRTAVSKHWTGDLVGPELVHVKIVDGELVGGGGPSCDQCSREILDSKLVAMWLFEINDAAIAPELPAASWYRYTAEEFHRLTLAACGLGG